MIHAQLRCAGHGEMTNGETSNGGCLSFLFTKIEGSDGDFYIDYYCAGRGILRLCLGDKVNLRRVIDRMV